jgi:hypothetical protein
MINKGAIKPITEEMTPILKDFQSQGCEFGFGVG